MSEVDGIGFEAASEEERETYSYGQCMWFAIAVHDRTGWPIEAVLDDQGSIGHAWVRMPQGQTFDVAGPGGAEDFITHPNDVISLDRRGILEISGTYDQQAVVAAGQVFDRMRSATGEEAWPKPQQTSAMRHYFGGFKSPPTSDIVKRYMRGDCGHFALAMNAVLDDSRILEVGIGHFAVEDREGNFWDARGKMTIEQLWSGMAGNEMVPKTREQTIAILDRGVYGNGFYRATIERSARKAILSLMDIAPKSRKTPRP